MAWIAGRDFDTLMRVAKKFGVAAYTFKTSQLWRKRRLRSITRHYGMVPATHAYPAFFI